MLENDRIFWKERVRTICIQIPTVFSTICVTWASSLASLTLWPVKWGSVSQQNLLNACVCWYCSRHRGYVSEQGSQNFYPQGVCNSRAYLKLLSHGRDKGQTSYPVMPLPLTSCDISASECNRTSHMGMLWRPPPHIHPCLCVYVEKAFLWADELHKEALLQRSWCGPIPGLGKRLDSTFSVPTWLGTLCKYM